MSQSTVNRERGIRMLQIDPGMIEMDSYFSETIDRDIAVEFTIPRNTSRRDALTMIHRQALRLSRRIELEAAVEGERMKHSKIGKTTFVTSCELVEDEVHVPAEVPPGMEQLREPTLITNNELFTEKVEALFKTTVESVIKEWQKKRLKIRSDKDEVAAGEEAVIHTNPAELFKDLVGQLVEKKLYEARNEAPFDVDENGDANIGDAESEATPDDQFDKLVERLRAPDKDADAGADSSESKGKKKKHKKKKKDKTPPAAPVAHDASGGGDGGKKDGKGSKAKSDAAKAKGKGKASAGKSNRKWLGSGKGKQEEHVFRASDKGKGKQKGENAAEKGKSKCEKAAEKCKGKGKRQGGATAEWPKRHPWSKR